jgi:hypothetical protein
LASVRSDFAVYMNRFGITPSPSPQTLKKPVVNLPSFSLRRDQLR